jgi:hypothetical protein
MRSLITYNDIFSEPIGKLVINELTLKLLLVNRTYAHSTKSWRSTVPVDTKWLLKVAAARLWRLPLREATTCLWRFHKLRIWEIFA